MLYRDNELGHFVHVGGVGGDSDVGYFAEEKRVGGLVGERELPGVIVLITDREYRSFVNNLIRHFLEVPSRQHFEISDAGVGVDVHQSYFAQRLVEIELNTLRHHHPDLKVHLVHRVSLRRQTELHISILQSIEPASEPQLN